MKKIRSFSNIAWYDFERNRIQSIEQEIRRKGKDYILKVDENEYAQYLVSTYKLEPINVDFDKEQIADNGKTTHQLKDRYFGERHNAEYYNIKISYPYSGYSILFEVIPDSRVLTDYEVTIEEDTVSLIVLQREQDPEKFKQNKNRAQSDAFANLKNINQCAEQWNSRLEKLVKDAFVKHKNELKNENSFFEAISLKTNKESNGLFSVPTVKKKVIPQPKLDITKEFSSEPTLSNSVYDDILQIIYNVGQNLERKPNLYIGKDEEGIRDQILLFLETRYEGTTATGETFNHSGKTDILLKYADDGSNLFIAECKFWRGASEYLDAINQLFDRYLTWRDTKVALIMFVDNKDFSSILDKIKENTEQHEYFDSHVCDRHESSFSYKFRLPKDKDKTVFLEVIAFHFDKKADKA